MSERPTIRLRPGYRYDENGRVVREHIKQVSADDILAILAWNKKQAQEQMPGAPKRKRGRPVGYRKPIESIDAAPDHIKALRASYCAKFIKTGQLDEQMAAQLRAYAASVNGVKSDGRKRHARSSRGVFAKHAPDHEGEGSRDAGDDGGRDHVHAVETAE